MSDATPTRWRINLIHRRFFTCWRPGKGVFYFLELNPRLQVEHPCSEMVSDVNLPAAQLQVAMGLPLHRIRDIRMLWREQPMGESPIDLDDLTKRRPANGHVVAARITAENPDEGFKPNNGQLRELTFRSSTNVWGYFSVSGSGGLHEYADSQFGHVFAWGETRDHARRSLAVALKEVSIRGDFRTTVEYLIKVGKRVHAHHASTRMLTISCCCCCSCWSRRRSRITTSARVG